MIPCLEKKPHVRITFSYRDCHDSFIKIPEVRGQLQELRVTEHFVRTTVGTGVGKRLHTLLSYPTMVELKSFSRGRSTNKLALSEHVLSNR